MTQPPSPPSHGLSPAELERYARHVRLPEVGAAGQARLKQGSVLIVGVGGLGSPVAEYLAAGGVGRIGLVDHDVVEVTNLHRQVIYSTHEVGQRKVDAARDRIQALNPNTKVEVHPARLTSENALGILRQYDVVVDASDNFPTRYLVNDACVLLGKPDVYASLYRFEGQASVFWAAKGPCYRCLHPSPPPPDLVPSCAEGGVLGVLPGIVGSIQANEALKLLLGVGEPLTGRLLLYDALDSRFVEVGLRKNPTCAVCGPAPTVRSLIDYEAFCGLTRPRPAADGVNLTPEELKAKMDAGESFLLLDVREPFEYQLARIEGSVLIPTQEVPSRVKELPKDREIVVQCHTGSRSLLVTRWLRNQGYQARNLAGGIDAWSRRVDPSVPQY